MNRSTIRVAFVTTHQIGVFKTTKRPTAAGVSTRLRALLPAEYLKKHGVIVQIVSLHESVWNGKSPLELDVDLIYVSKVLRVEAADAIISLQNRVPLVFDFCDNYFEGGEHFELHQKLLNAASIVTVNTPEMARVLRRLKPQIAVSVIPDMIESELKKPKLNWVDAPLSLLAFGSKLTCTHLNRWLPELAIYSQSHPLRVELVTLVDDEVVSWHKVWQDRLPETLTLTLTLWNEYQLPHCFARNDVVLIPSDEGDFYLTKSANRLIEATISGLPCIAYPIRSYTPYWKSIALTDNPSAALRFLTTQRQKAKSEVSEAQKQMLIAHDSQDIGKMWLELTRLVTNPSDEKLARLNARSEFPPYIINLHQPGERSVYDPLLATYADLPKVVQGQWIQCGFVHGSSMAGFKEDPVFYTHQPRRFSTPLADQLCEIGLLSVARRLLERIVASNVLTPSQAASVIEKKWFVPNPWEIKYQIDYGLEQLRSLSKIDHALRSLQENLEAFERDILLSCFHSYMLMEIYEMTGFFNTGIWKSNE